MSSAPLVDLSISMNIEAFEMRIALAMVGAVFIMALVAAGQLVAATQPVPTGQPLAAAPIAPTVPVSTELQPALGSVHQAVDLVRTDKWKKGNIRDEAAQNISQIQRDIDVTLPPMLRDADTAPTTLSSLLPVSRNLSALYDVLLRVVEASRIVAPDEQVEQLQKALVTLGNARLAFGDRMQTAAVAMEKQVTDLRTTVKTQADKIEAVPTPVAVPCTPAPKPTPKKTTRKPAAKTTGTKSTTPAGSTQTKPSSSQQNNSQQNTPPQSTH
jgi:hypothetical protein